MGIALGSTDVGTGTTLTSPTGTTLTDEIVGIEWSDWERPKIDTTHLGSSTVRSKIPGDLYDVGDITLDCHFDCTLAPDMGDAAGVWTLQLVDGTSTTTWAVDAFVSGFSMSIPLEDKMTCQYTLSPTGVVTVTTA